MVYKYALMPIVAWFAAGTLKFMVNYIRFQKQAVNLIGNGGFPSTHSTIMSSTVFLIGLSEGLSSPIFGLGVAVLMITVIDALGIRRAVGKQAKAINRYMVSGQHSEPVLRERQGHSPVEVLGGLSLGLLLAYLFHQI
ncbi:divergent PAP2 family protein [Pelosinus sp. sgz500959]|uniref:divergent PAP2 family protein n=1 Tax=Pelosinus sp. sgz500959 TaxID=3242472 RepID=UPI00366FF5DF